MKPLFKMISYALLLPPCLTACFPLVAGGAAVGTVALVASDRRTSGAYVEDQGIEVKLAKQLNSRFPDSHINVTSYNRAVLLTGEVTNQVAQQDALQMARGTPNVRKVWDYTVVDTPSVLATRNNDAWITTKVRTRLLNGTQYPPQTIKVVTERGVTYLMGLVTKAEGDAVLNVVRSTSGVQKVVPLFEYLTEDVSVAP